ncbi:SurA N-terminal domain-containing protein [uncultured Mailhella sp.]|uniref:SurA N-terminal domain-containing protein n=1 Tax=uncultured Mailhella sp. TaxID=1981031 RepID=UPI0025CFFAE6|nr:SurA N-terminal domain-containing protein [uncultured Mailhella sp.]
MLDGIRANAQSWGVKLAFGIIIVVFVFWGIGSYSGPKGLVASVNGRNITEVEFQRAYAMMEDNVRRSIPNVTSEMLESFQLEQRVLQSLMQEKLIEDEAERAGLTISPYELRAALEQLPFFQKDGKFDADTYREVLSKNHITPRQFETDQAKSMLPAKLQRLVTAGAYVDPSAVKAIFDYAAERRRVDYILFPASAHMDKAAPSDEEVAKTYEAQSANFTVPPSVNVEFIRLDPAVMGDPASISDADLRAAYDARKNQFTEEEKIHARHILVRVPANAPEADVKKAEEQIKALEARIRGGEDFAEVARSGQDGTAEQGGDLGWFTAGQMVPEFSKAAFALKDGEVSAPVRTQFGFHLIKKEEHKPAVTHSFDEVKDSLRTQLATEAAGRGLEEKADVVLAQALAGKSMDEAARAASVAAVKAESTGLISAEELGQKLDIRDSDVQTILAAASGTVLDSAVPSGNALLVVKVLESKPQSVKPLEEVRPLIVEFLTRQKAAEMAMDDARKARAAFQNGKPAEGAEIKTSEPFGRDGNIADLIADPALAQAAFAVPQVSDAWLNDPYRVQDGAVLARVSAIEAPSEDEWKAAAQDMQARMTNDRANLVYQVYLTQLGSQAKVKMYNSPLLAKTNK